MPVGAGQVDVRQVHAVQVGGAHSKGAPPIALGAVDGPQSVSATLNDLPAGTTFRVRVSVTTGGSGASATSEPVEFSTVPLPPFVPTPREPVDPNPYGCVAPRLDAHPGKVAPGQRVTLTGSDLGVYGKVTIGRDQVEAADWASSRITIVVPSEARGSLSVTADCGKMSNAIALTIAVSPSNRVAASVGANGALTLRVPGKGRLTVKGAGVRTVTRNPSRKSTAKVKLKLTKAGRKQLAKSKSGKLSRRVRIAFRPAGGSARTVTRTVTFTQG